MVIGNCGSLFRQLLQTSGLDKRPKLGWDYELKLAYYDKQKEIECFLNAA